MWKFGFRVYLEIWLEIRIALEVRVYFGKSDAQKMTVVAGIADLEVKQSAVFGNGETAVQWGGKWARQGAFLFSCSILPEFQEIGEVT